MMNIVSFLVLFIRLYWFIIFTAATCLNTAFADDHSASFCSEFERPFDCGNILEITNDENLDPNIECKLNYIRYIR